MVIPEFLNNEQCISSMACMGCFSSRSLICTLPSVRPSSLSVSASNDPDTVTSSSMMMRCGCGAGTTENTYLYSMHTTLLSLRMTVPSVRYHHRRTTNCNACIVYQRQRTTPIRHCFSLNCCRPPFLLFFGVRRFNDSFQFSPSSKVSQQQPSKTKPETQSSLLLKATNHGLLWAEIALSRSLCFLLEGYKWIFSVTEQDTFVEDSSLLDL
jgi:hypothetical protein